MTLLDAVTGDPDFPFDFNLIRDDVPGLDRGNLGILFARPEVGKTTFCCFLAASYIRQGFKVVYWANEEPADRIMLRIIQSFFSKTKDEMNGRVGLDAAVKYRDEIAPVSDDHRFGGYVCRRGKRIRQAQQAGHHVHGSADKFRISREFNRGDERLKETYVLAREIAKRNKLLVWAVSQASYDAHDRQFIDYAMLDNSRTGKAGEADIIIGHRQNRIKRRDK